MMCTISFTMTTHPPGYSPMMTSKSLPNLDLSHDNDIVVAVVVVVVAAVVVIVAVVVVLWFCRKDPDYRGNAISNASFSKIFGPGMRLGWMEAPDRVRKSLQGTGLCRSGGSFNHTISGLMTSVIELGLLQDLLKESRPIYKASRESNLVLTLVCACRLSAMHCVML